MITLDLPPDPDFKRFQDLLSRGRAYLDDELYSDRALLDNDYRQRLEEFFKTNANTHDTNSSGVASGARLGSGQLARRPAAKKPIQAKTKGDAIPALWE